MTSPANRECEGDPMANGLVRLSLDERRFRNHGCSFGVVTFLFTDIEGRPGAGKSTPMRCAQLSPSGD
jgi:hypothetical protein